MKPRRSAEWLTVVASAIVLGGFACGSVGSAAAFASSAGSAGGPSTPVSALPQLAPGSAGQVFPDSTGPILAAVAPSGSLVGTFGGSELSGVSHQGHEGPEGSPGSASTATQNPSADPPMPDGAAANASCVACSSSVAWFSLTTGTLSNPNGNDLLAFVVTTYGQSGSVSASDISGTSLSWNLLTSSTFQSVYHQYFFWAVGVTASPVALSLNPGIAASASSSILFALENVNTSSPVYLMVSSAGFSATPSATVSTSSNDTVLGVLSTGDAPIVTATPGFTALNTVTDGASPISDETSFAEFEPAPAGGAYTVSPTLNTSEYWGESAIAFQSSAPSRLVAPVISVSPATPIDSGQNATISTTSSFSGGTAPYSCQWLEESPGSAVYSDMGAAFACGVGDTPSASTGPLAIPGTWSFELEVTGSSSGGPNSATSNAVTVTVTAPTVCQPGADLQGANLAGADLAGGNCRGANLDHADLAGADLEGADFQGVNAQHADLAGVDGAGLEAQGANLRHADLSGADLVGADLQGVNAEHADLAGIDGVGLQGQGANLRHADLEGADLQGADLRGANLEHADLSGADVGGASFQGANLEHGDLAGATLTGLSVDQPTNFDGANLKHTDFAGAICGSPDYITASGAKLDHDLEVPPSCEPLTGGPPRGPGGPPHGPGGPPPGPGGLPHGLGGPPPGPGGPPPQPRAPPPPPPRLPGGLRGILA